MIEKEMGNRGSKLKKVLLKLNNTLLKEQRVEGSWQLLSGDNPCLRFTLTGYESNSPPEDGRAIYRAMILSHKSSNQIPF